MLSFASLDRPKVEYWVMIPLELLENGHGSSSARGRCPMSCGPGFFAPFVEVFDGLRDGGGVGVAVSLFNDAESDGDA